VKVFLDHFPQSRSKCSKCRPCVRTQAGRAVASYTLAVRSTPDFNQSLLKFVHVIDASLVYALLHDAPNLVVDRVQVGAVWRPQISSDGGLALQQLSLNGLAGGWPALYRRLLDPVIILYKPDI